MFSYLKKEDAVDAKKPITSTSGDMPLGGGLQQKPSPSSTGEDVTGKGDNHTQTTQDGVAGKYARKKSGLKPIRPAGFSASNLNPTTPGKNFGSSTGFNPITPGKMSYTPRLNYKENDPTSRFMGHEFPTTPKFGRSESTPELHRIKKMDFNTIGDLNHQSGNAANSDKTTGAAGTNHVLQESNVSNLLTLTSDSLPDIFRRPAAMQQQQLDKTEEKVSKWGYGPSCPSKPVQHAEETQPTKQQPTLGKPPFTNPWMKPLGFQQQQPAEDPVAALSFNMSLDKSAASDTASALGLPTTIKAQPVLPLVPQPATSQAPGKQEDPPVLSSEKTPAASWAVSSARAPEPSHPPALTTRSLDSSVPFKQVSIGQQQQPPPPPSVRSVADTQPVKVSQSSAVAQPKNPSPPAGCLPNSQPSLPPPSATRPTGKTKQIMVNGKAYTVMKPLGRGGSSVVYQVLNPEMTDVFALKVVRLDAVDEVTAEGYVNEVRLLKQLQGLPRVVRLVDYEYNEEEEKLLLVMEKGDTDFATVVRTRTSLNAINPTLVRFYWQEMLESVGEIHNKNVIHSDLKPANFLLVNGGLKLIDFGIATSIQGDMTSIMKDSQCGTYNYMAPEAIKSASPVGTHQEYKISRKTDVWSLGCMLYSLIYKNPPFNKFRDTIEKINAIVDERYAIEFPPTADPLAVSVLRACLDRNPRNRPSIEQLLNHPYLTGTSASGSSPVPAPKPAVGPSYLRSQLELFMDSSGHLTDEAKEWIRQWM